MLLVSEELARHVRSQLTTFHKERVQGVGVRAYLAYMERWDGQPGNVCGHSQRKGGLRDGGELDECGGGEAVQEEREVVVKKGRSERRGSVGQVHLVQHRVVKVTSEVAEAGDPKSHLVAQDLDLRAAENLNLARQLQNLFPGCCCCGLDEAVEEPPLAAPARASAAEGRSTISWA